MKWEDISCVEEEVPFSSRHLTFLDNSWVAPFTDIALLFNTALRFCRDSVRTSEMRLPPSQQVLKLGDAFLTFGWSRRRLQSRFCNVWICWRRFQQKWRRHVENLWPFRPLKEKLKIFKGGHLFKATAYDIEKVGHPCTPKKLKTFGVGSVGPHVKVATHTNSTHGNQARTLGSV
jgi:hypothetical protein